MRGRKPKPTNLKVLQGTARPDRVRGDEPRPDPNLPAPPDHLSADALVEWGRISGQLYKLGLLSEIDRSALAAYCQAYGRWVQAERALAARISEADKGGLLDTTPNGLQQQHALVGIANKALELMHKFLTEFGMTPSARSRLSVGKDKEKESRFKAAGL